MPRKKRATSDEVTVTLIAPHRHAGRNRETGEPITVRRSLLPTLEAMGVIAPGAGDDAGAAKAGEGGTTAPAGTFEAPAESDLGDDGAPNAEDGDDGADPDGHDRG